MPYLNRYWYAPIYLVCSMPCFWARIRTYTTPLHTVYTYIYYIHDIHGTHYIHTLHCIALHTCHKYLHHTTYMYLYIAFHKYVQIHTHIHTWINKDLPIYLPTYIYTYIDIDTYTYTRKVKDRTTPQVNLFHNNKQWLKLYWEGGEDKGDGGGPIVVKSCMWKCYVWKSCAKVDEGACKKVACESAACGIMWKGKSFAFKSSQWMSCVWKMCHEEEMWVRECVCVCVKEMYVEEVSVKGQGRNVRRRALCDRKGVCVCVGWVRVRQDHRSRFLAKFRFGSRSNVARQTVQIVMETDGLQQISGGCRRLLLPLRLSNHL